MQGNNVDENMKLFILPENASGERFELVDIMKAVGSGPERPGHKYHRREWQQNHWKYFYTDETGKEKGISKEEATMKGLPAPKHEEIPATPQEATLKRLKEFVTVDDISQDKEGNFIFRDSFYYTHDRISDRVGETDEGFANKVAKDLENEGFPKFQIVGQGTHNAPFKGSASVKNSSHWWVKVKFDKLEMPSEKEKILEENLKPKIIKNKATGETYVVTAINAKYFVDKGTYEIVNSPDKPAGKEKLEEASKRIKEIQERKNWSIDEAVKVIEEVMGIPASDLKKYMAEQKPAEGKKEGSKAETTVRVNVRGIGVKEKTFPNQEKANKWIDKLRESDDVEILAYSEEKSKPAEEAFPGRGPLTPEKPKHKVTYPGGKEGWVKILNKNGDIYHVKTNGGQKLILKAGDFGFNPDEPIESNPAKEESPGRGPLTPEKPEFKSPEKLQKEFQIMAAESRAKERQKEMKFKQDHPELQQFMDSMELTIRTEDNGKLTLETPDDPSVGINSEKIGPEFDNTQQMDAWAKTHLKQHNELWDKYDKNEISADEVYETINKLPK